MHDIEVYERLKRFLEKYCISVCMYVCMYVCSGVSFPVTLTVPDFPFDPTQGSHPVLLENEIFIGMYVCMYVCMYVGSRTTRVMMSHLVIPNSYR